MICPSMGTVALNQQSHDTYRSCASGWRSLETIKLAIELQEAAVSSSAMLCIGPKLALFILRVRYLGLLIN